MTLRRPQFELTRVYTDGTNETPEIVPVTAVPWSTPMSRRGALGIGIGAAALICTLDGRNDAEGAQLADSPIKAPDKPLFAHGAALSGLAMTPDGRLLVSGSADNTVKLWSMPEGRWLSTLPSHPDDVRDLVVTPDGHTLVTACLDTLRVWSLPEGRLLTAMDDHTDAINALAVTPDGRTLISAGDDKTLRLWSLPAGRLLATLEGHTMPVHFLAVSSDGTSLVSGGKQGGLRLWLLAERRLLARLSGSATGAFALLPNGSAVVTGSSDIEVRSLDDGRLLSSMRSSGALLALAVAANGTLLAAASRDALSLWSLPGGTLVRSAPLAGAGQRSLAFSPDSHLLLSWADNDLPRCWSVPDLQVIARPQPDASVRLARFSTDSRQLITGQSSGTLSTWNARPAGFERYLADPVFDRSVPPDRTIRAHKEAVTALAVSEDSGTLASAARDSPAKIWSLPGGQLLFTLDGHKDGINDIAFTAAGKICVTASSDRTIKFWDVPGVAPASKRPPTGTAPQAASPGNARQTPKGRVIATLEGHGAGVRKVLPSADGSTLVSIDQAHVVKVWSVPERRLLSTLPEQKGELQGSAVTADGGLLALATTEGTEGPVTLWSLPDGRRLTTLGGLQRTVHALAIAPDGRLLAVASGEDSLSLWELPGGRLVRSLDGLSSAAFALAFAPDGKLIAAGTREGVSLWSAPSGRLLTRLEEDGRGTSGYQREGAALAFSLDARFLLSTASNGAIAMWSLSEGRKLMTFDAQVTAAEAMAIAPDSRTLACGDSGGRVSLWDLERPGFRTFLFDPTANASDVKGVTYSTYDQVTGQTLTYTLPCGSPIPSGATCVCNCVPGTVAAPTYRAPRSGGGGGGGSYCSCNRVCTCIPISDRNVKEGFEATDPHLVLQRLSDLQIQMWNYKWEDAAIRHIGPMAQDFAAAFAVGEDDTHIHPLDAQGVAFAAIQGLHKIVRDAETRAERLQAQLEYLVEENDRLRARLDALESLATRK